MASRPVALTFDDGPDPVWTPRVLDALRRERVRATFFVLGEHAERHAELVRAIAAEGHSIQPHCWGEHRAHQDLEREQIETDIDRTLDVLRSLELPAPAVWRPPFGTVKRPDSFEIAASRGLTLMGWTIDARDYRPESSAEAMLALLLPLRAPRLAGAVLRQLRRRTAPATTRPGVVVLLHDARIGTPRETCENTVELIAPLARAVRERGWEFQPMFSPRRYPNAVIAR